MQNYNTQNSSQTETAPQYLAESILENRSALLLSIEEYISQRTFELLAKKLFDENQRLKQILARQAKQRKMKNMEGGVLDSEYFAKIKIRNLI